MIFSRMSFDVTNACNLKCKHCLRMDKEEITYMSMELFEKIYNQSKVYGTREFMFTGGEPFLHPNLSDMVDMIVKDGRVYSLVTNGTIPDKIAKLLDDDKRRSHLKALSVSLEGATEETCDTVRGEGVYRKVMVATALLRSKGVTFGYKMSFNKLNCNEIEKFILDAAKMDARYVELSHMHPTPELLDHDLIVPKSKWGDIDAVVKRMIKIVRMPINYCAGAYIKEPMPACTSIHMTDVHIDCRGNVAFCCVLPYFDSGDEKRNRDVLAGNLNEIDLWDAHKRLASLVARFNQAKIKKIKEGTLHRNDHYQCMYCLKYFGKLNWLKENYPDNEWVEGWL